MVIILGIDGGRTVAVVVGADGASGSTIAMVMRWQWLLVAMVTVRWRYWSEFVELRWSVFLMVPIIVECMWV